MADMPSSFNRKPALGGFNAAGADATYFVPILQQAMAADPAAAAAGQKTGETSFTSDPQGAVSNSFSASASSAGGNPSPMPDMPNSEVIPKGITAEQIAQLYQPYLNQIEAMHGPEARGVPQPTPPLATFFSVLAGSLGAQLTRNPIIERQILETLQANEERRQAISDQNYAQNLLFNQQQDARRLAAMGSMAEKEVDSAIKDNDFERAMKADKNLTIIKGQMEERQIALTGQEQRKGISMTVEGKEGAVEEKGKLEPKDYAARRGEILTSKEQPEDKGGMFFGIGKTHPRLQSLANLDKIALHSGNKATMSAAQRNIVKDTLLQLKMNTKTNFTAKDEKSITTYLQEVYDLTPQEVGIAFEH